MPAAPTPKRKHGPNISFDTPGLRRRTAKFTVIRPVIECKPNIIQTWFCRFCRQWTMRGAHVTGRCNFCETPRA